MWSPGRAADAGAFVSQPASWGTPAAGPGNAGDGAGIAAPKEPESDTP